MSDLYVEKFKNNIDHAIPLTPSPVVLCKLNF